MEGTSLKKTMNVEDAGTRIWSPAGIFLLEIIC